MFEFLFFVVNEQLIAYFENNNLFYEGQSGFRHKHSCEASFLFVMNKWKTELDNSKSILTTFLDLKRAFETIDRSVLLKKLKYYGLGYNIIQWFHSYLDKREQVTKYNGKISSKISNPFGIPQGSVLGPTLFIIYINDIHFCTAYTTISLFADDALLSISGNDHDVLVESMMLDLERINNWLIANKLKLNVNKTKCMFIGSKQNCYKFFSQGSINVYLAGQKLEFVHEIKYLGFLLDQHLNFKSHIDYLIKKISKKIGFLSRSTKYLSTWAKINIYNCIIKPHFQYSNSIIFMTSELNKLKLQKLQNRAMRVILKANKYTRIKDMLQVLNWMDIATYSKFSVMVLIFKSLHNLLPAYLSRNLNFNKDFHNYNTRIKNDIRVPKARKISTTKSVFHKGLAEYNSLPKKLKHMSDVNKFKAELKKYWPNRKFGQ